MASESPRPFWATVLGAASVSTLPVAIAITRYSGTLELLHSGVSIPIGLGLGWVALVQSRKVRGRAEATLASTERRRTASLGRVLGILGICMASSATIAVAVYAVLTYID